MLFHVPNQTYKRLKIKYGQNDRSSNSSVKDLLFIQICDIDSLRYLTKCLLLGQYSSSSAH